MLVFLLLFSTSLACFETNDQMEPFLLRQRAYIINVDLQALCFSSYLEEEMLVFCGGHSAVIKCSSRWLPLVLFSFHFWKRS